MSSVDSEHYEKFLQILSEPSSRAKLEGMLIGISEGRIKNDFE